MNLSKLFWSVKSWQTSLKIYTKPYLQSFKLVPLSWYASFYASTFIIGHAFISAVRCKDFLKVHKNHVNLPWWETLFNDQCPLTPGSPTNGMLINPRSSEQILEEIQILKIEQIQQIPESLNSRHNRLFSRSNIVPCEQSMNTKNAPSTSPTLEAQCSQCLHWKLAMEVCQVILSWR